MRHNKDSKKFSRHAGHLRCMLANMTCDVIKHGRIKTTTSKAKELRRYVDRMITLGKAGDTPARRRAMAFLRSKVAVKKLFDEVSPVFKTRNGGYTRILKCGLRAGDSAPMSIIELVEAATEVEPEEGAAKKSAAKTDKKTTSKGATKKSTEKKPAAKTEKKSTSKGTAKKPTAKEPAAKKAAATKAAKQKEGAKASEKKAAADKKKK